MGPSSEVGCSGSEREKTNNSEHMDPFTQNGFKTFNVEIICIYLVKGMHCFM